MDIPDSLIAEIVRSRDTRKATKEAEAKAPPIKGEQTRTAIVAGVSYAVSVSSQGVAMTRGNVTKAASWESVVDSSVHARCSPGADMGGYADIPDAAPDAVNGVSGAVYRPIHCTIETSATSITKATTQWRVVLDRWGVWMKPIASDEVSSDGWRYSDWFELSVTVRRR